MTVEKGRPWGSAGPLTEHGEVVETDARARNVVTEAKRTGTPVPELGFLGGDLWRTCGAPTGGVERLSSSAARRLPVDLGSVLLDGTIHWFVAHLVAKRSWWHGPIVAAMNAQFIGDWDVAPRSHPNDGRLDTFEVSMGIADRLKARARLRTGTHVPHPDIAQRRVTTAQFDLPARTTVWLDGEPVGQARHLSIRVEPDALLCVV